MQLQGRPVAAGGLRQPGERIQRQVSCHFGRAVRFVRPEPRERRSVFTQVVTAVPEQHRLPESPGCLEHCQLAAHRFAALLQVRAADVAGHEVGDLHLVGEEPGCGRTTDAGPRVALGPCDGVLSPLIVTFFFVCMSDSLTNGTSGWPL